MPTFVPQQVRVDFSVHFDHSRGISQKAIQEALQRIADAGTDALVGREWPGRNATRRMSVPAQAVCSQTAHETKCTEACKDYVASMCNQCGCDSTHGGTAQCVCVLSKTVVFAAVFISSIQAMLMLLCGLVVWRRVIKTPPLEQPWPNIAEQEFESGIFDCTSNLSVTLMVCCCPAVRGTMTYYNAGWFKGYVKMLLVLCLIYGIPAFLGMFAFMPIVLFLGRRQIRIKAPMHGDIWTDICFVCMCSACAMCQEARHTDASLAYLNKKKLAESGDLIGQAVAIEEHPP